MPEREVRQITLATLADGAVDELFLDALGKVLANIEDPNTDAKTKRGIRIDIEVVPDEDRRAGKFNVRYSTKLAGVKGVKVDVYFGRHEGLPVAVEAPRQVDLFPTPQSTPRLVAGTGTGT